jgi:dnd system-associated protein 4
MKLDVPSIKRPAEYEDIFQRYANPQYENKIPSSPFNSMKDFCMICAIMGYNSGIYKPFDKGEPIRTSIFSNYDIKLIKMIAVAHTKDVTVLQDHEKVVKIFEGFINGGVPVVLEKLSNEETMQFDYVKLVLDNQK